MIIFCGGLVYSPDGSGVAVLANKILLRGDAPMLTQTMNRKVSRFLALTTPLAFVFFTACGGGAKKPPQPAKSEVDPAILENLYQHAQKAQESCATDYTPVFVQLAQQYMAAPQIPCGAGGAIPGAPNYPIAMPFGGQQIAGQPQAGQPVNFGAQQPMMGQVVGMPGGSIYPGAPVGGIGMPGMPGMCGMPQLPPLPVPQPQTDQCQNDIKNLIATFITIKSKDGKVLYANDPAAQAWFSETVASLMTRVGGNVQAQLPGAPMQDPNFLAFMFAQGGRAAMQMGPQLGSPLPLQLLQQNMGQLQNYGIPMPVFQQFMGGV